MNYRQLADHVKQRQRLKLGRMHDPEDDWLPEAYFVHPREGMRRVPIPPPFFRDRESKSYLFNGLLAPAIRAGSVRLFAFVVVMFMLDADHPMAQVIYEREQEGRESPTAGLPYFQDVDGSVEQLWVHVFDAERHEGWHATITRPKSGPPQLAPFTLAGGGADQYGGDLVDPIKEALR